VPARVSVLAKLLAVLPQRGRDLAYQRLVPDQLRETDRSRRSGYETRFDGPEE
jgi:hypothetical protein